MNRLIYQTSYNYFLKFILSTTSNGRLMMPYLENLTATPLDEIILII